MMFEAEWRSPDGERVKETVAADSYAEGKALIVARVPAEWQLLYIRDATADG